MATASNEIRVTPEIALEHGVTREEYARIQQILGRDPNITELGIFSVMWSEHCSYKSSKVHLKRLPTRGKLVVQGPGENAGVVDIGDGLVAAFKIESHNHPSYVEPFQGATKFMVPLCSPPLNSPRSRSRNARTCKSAIPSWKSFFSKPALRPCKQARSSRFRTWVPPASRAPPWRWLREAARASKLTSPKSRSAKPA